MQPVSRTSARSVEDDAKSRQGAVLPPIPYHDPGPALGGAPCVNRAFDAASQQTPWHGPVRANERVDASERPRVPSAKTRWSGWSANGRIFEAGTHRPQGARRGQLESALLCALLLWSIGYCFLMPSKTS